MLEAFRGRSSDSTSPKAIARLIAERDQVEKRSDKNTSKRRPMEFSGTKTRRKRRGVLAGSRMDLGRIVALTWLLVAAGTSILLGPELGWRGLLWLGTHNLLCLVGAGHELWRKRKPPPRVGG